MNEIWGKLEVLMAQNGLSKSALGRIAGVTPSAVNGWRNGNRISPPVIKRLSDHFKTDLTGLISEFNPDHASLMMAESRVKYETQSLAKLDSLSEEIKKLSERISAIEQLMIKGLAVKEKDKK